MTEPTNLWHTPEHADVDALEAAWDDHRLSQILAAALDSYNRLGRVNAHRAAAELDVSEGTIRRWVRDGVPAGKLHAVRDLVRPPQGAFEQEYSDLVVGRDALKLIATDPERADALWGALGWLEPHDLAIVRLSGAPIHVARLARHDRNSAGTTRLLEGGEKNEKRRYKPPVALVTFPNRWAATVARLELLEDVYAYRVQLPEGKITRGAGKAWLADAPHKPLSSFRRPRKRIRSTTTAIGVR